ncbi:GNAT family N-acetyltransferase [Pseudomonas stutzeri]|uniref:GNAT family N-acetyltransferase n=1 Tax=Stutzerimonas frequens TaxID=2968969 RepID=UPI00190D9157|nr:GNAT family N-acetyltransferase [Stutzerimonas frequens]MBK3919991.1 GNAT family N-acetyltransferase [Stutzerimonas frequens]
MEIMHFTNGINPLVMEESIKLAVSEAPAMVATVVDGDSPLLPLAEAEVEAMLRDALRMVGAGVRQRVDGVLADLRVGIIAAVDDEAGQPCLAGFIQYKPRLRAEGTATIGYAAVAPAYRGQGIFKKMLNELKVHYPILGLDCSLELVPMYERLGFRPEKRQGAHVGMATAPLGGVTWGQGQEFLDNHPLYQRAKERIRTTHGKATRDAYAKRDADTRKRIEEINAFLQLRADEARERAKASRAYFEDGCACIHTDKTLQPCRPDMPDAEAVAFYEQHCKCSRNYVEG